MTTTKEGKLGGIQSRIASACSILNFTFTIGLFNLVLACSLSLFFCQPRFLLVAKSLVTYYFMGKRKK